MSPRVRHSETPTPKRPIGQLLVAAGLVSEHQVDEALAMQRDKGGKLVENLITLEYLDARTFLKFLSTQPGMASIDLLNYMIPKQVLDLVPADFALQHEILPLDQMGKYLTVGMACPLDSKTVGELEGMTGLKVKPLLVSINDIRTAIKRYYGGSKAKADTSKWVDRLFPTAPGQSISQPPDATAAVAPPPPPAENDPIPKVESAITFEGVVGLVRKVSSLPALPETTQRMRDAMNNPDTTTLEAAQIISRDPSISAKVLSLANSPAYGFHHRVETVELAASLLGLREIYSVVLSSAVIDYFDHSKRFDYKAFWRRSMFCATAAKIVAKACGRKDGGGIFAAGLLHDLGRLVFSEVAPERYSEIDANLSNGELIAEETRKFGVAHPEVGYVLANAWDLPHEITAPMRFHHAFELAPDLRDSVAIVALAAMMVDTYGKLTKETAPAFMRDCKPLLHQLKLSEKQFVAVLGDTSQAVKAQLA